MIPIGLNLTSMGVSSAWWLDAGRRAEQAGFAAVWCWDHFISQGRDKSTPVLECWTTLAATAAITSRLRVGSFVTNVMNRHPAVLARMVATLADQSGGRIDLGIGVGGNAGEMSAYGIAFPPAKERTEVLEEAVAVLRALWSGGPADYEGRQFRLREAWAHPVPSPAPRIIVGGESASGARLAARVGDAWTTNGPDYDRLLPIHTAQLQRHGRTRADVAHVVAVKLSRDEPLERQPLIADMRGFLEAWRERGADEIVVSWVRPDQLEPLLGAARRAGLTSASVATGRH